MLLALLDSLRGCRAPLAWTLLLGWANVAHSQVHFTPAAQGLPRFVGQPAEPLVEPPLRPRAGSPEAADATAEDRPTQETVDFATSGQPVSSPFLQFGQINVGYSWAYSDTSHIYAGTERQRAAEQAAQVRVINSTHNLAFEMGLCDREAIVVEMPFQYNSRRQQTGPISGGRINGYFVTDTGDLADMKVYWRKWLYDQDECVPLFCQPGNVSVAAGVKLPTGREDKYTFFNGGDGGRDYFHDISVQTGTGSTDIYLAASGYLDMGYLFPFAGVNWLITPDETNGVLAFHPQIADPNTTIVNSVTDAITWTVGFRYDLGRALVDGRCGCNKECCPNYGKACDPCCCGQTRQRTFTLDKLRVSFALQGSHVPENDIFNGSTGFRRAYDALFLEPGLQYDLGANSTFFASVPLTVYRDLKTEAGTFPHTQLIVGMNFNIR